MNKDISNMQMLVLGLSLSALLFTGCTSQPKTPLKTPKTPVVQKNTTAPAELYLSSKSINTDAVRQKQQASYNLKVKIDNTKNSSAFINLENRGSSVLDISKISFNDSDKLFTLESACGKTIQPNSKCKLKVSFIGKKAGVFTSDIIINSNSNGKSVGKVGKINIVANTIDRVTAIINPLEIQENSVDKKPMTELSFNKENSVQYAEIRNNGFEDIEIKGLKFVGEGKEKFTYTHNCLTTLKVGESCNIEVKYVKKNDKIAVNYIVVESDGAVYPSDTIRLKGTSLAIPTPPAKAPAVLKLAAKDDMGIHVIESSVNGNIEKFLEDHLDTKPVYYIRTMYQTDTDPKYAELYESTILYFFEKNGYSVTSNPERADKILNMYPTIALAKNGKGTILVKSNVKVNVVTKSSNGKTSQDEKIDFNISVTADGYSDEYFAYVGIAYRVNSFMFNLLGLED